MITGPSDARERNAQTPPHKSARSRVSLLHHSNSFLF